jgi:hypothetical protein
MQQHYANSTQTGQTPGMLMTFIENYLSYRFNKFDMRLDSELSQFVEGQVAILFCPESMSVDSSNFVSIIQRRRADKKVYPGTFIVPLSKLRDAKRMTFNGEFKKGGRPIGGTLADPSAGKSVVGKVVIGMFTDAYTGEATGIPTSSSSDGSGATAPITSQGTMYVGPIATLSMHVDMTFIYAAPGQLLPQGRITAVRTLLNWKGDYYHADPAGVGDYGGGIMNGVSPAR